MNLMIGTKKWWLTLGIMIFRFWPNPMAYIIKIWVGEFYVYYIDLIPQNKKH